MGNNRGINKISRPASAGNAQGIAVASGHYTANILVNILGGKQGRGLRRELIDTYGRGNIGFDKLALLFRDRIDGVLGSNSITDHALGKILHRVFIGSNGGNNTPRYPGIISPAKYRKIIQARLLNVAQASSKTRSEIYGTVHWTEEMDEFLWQQECRQDLPKGRKGRVQIIEQAVRAEFSSVQFSEHSVEDRLRVLRKQIRRP